VESKYQQSPLSEINIYSDGSPLLNPRICFFKVTGNADVWKLYSDLYKDGESEEEKDKVVNILTCRNPVCNTIEIDFWPTSLLVNF
jgi:hypothetical protein